MSASESLAGHVTAGETGDVAYRRLLASAAAHAGLRGFPSIDVSSNYGRVSAVAPPFEQFVVGGLASSLIDPSLVTQRVAMGALPVGVAAGERLLSYRLSTSLLGLAPYYWGASTQDGSDHFDRWHRVIGAELTMDQTPVPVIGLPGARFLVGVGYSLDEPFRHQTRGYLAVTLRP
jgi:hypothetical protein